MLLHPSNFAPGTKMQKINAASTDKSEVQDLLALFLRHLQQTTGVPSGRQAVFSLMKILENMMLVPETYTHISQMPEFWTFFSRLMNLHSMSPNDFKMTIVAGRMLKLLFVKLNDKMLDSPKFPTLLQEITLQVKKGLAAVTPEDRIDLKEAVRQARNANVAVQDARQAQEDLHEKMGKVEEYSLEADRLENSDLVEERRRSMAVREMLQEALREAEEAATILQIKETKAKRLLGAKAEDYDSDEKVMSAAAAADDAAEMMAELTNTHQGRMQVLTSHPQLRDMFEIFCGALGEGICHVGASAALESITCPVGCGEWLMQTSGLAFEHDQRSRLTKFDIVRPVSNMLASKEVVAQRTSLRVLMNLFQASHFMEPLHPSGEAVKYILLKLGQCLSSEDEELAMYSARVVNRLTGYHHEAAPRRAILVQGQEGGVFLTSLCTLLLNASTHYDLGNVAVTLSLFLCNKEVYPTLEAVLQATPEIPELTTFQYLMGYTKQSLPSSERGDPHDAGTLSGDMRNALCHALCSDVPAAASAAAEAMLCLVDTPAWRLWLISGRGTTSPTNLITMLLQMTKDHNPQLAEQLKTIEEIPVEEQPSSGGSWFGSLFGASAASVKSLPSPPATQAPPQFPAEACPIEDVVEDLRLDACEEEAAKEDKEKHNVEEVEKAGEEAVVAGNGFGNLSSLEVATSAPGNSSGLNLSTLPSMPHKFEEERSEDSMNELAVSGEASHGNTVTRADMLNTWVFTQQNNVQSVRPDFGEAPVPISDEEAMPVVWTGRQWMQGGASGVVAQTLALLAQDPGVIAKLSTSQDCPKDLARLLLFGLISLLPSHYGGVHAAKTLDTLTSESFGLGYLSLLGPRGIDDIIQRMNLSVDKITEPQVKKTVASCAKRLEDAKPKN